MTIPKDLVSLLVCPISLGPVRLSTDEKWVVCPQSQMQYPIRDGVPIMIAEEGVRMGQIADEEEVPVSSENEILIYIAEGKNKGLEVSLPLGGCRAIGRSLDDMESTQVFDSSGIVGLDDNTKQLVLTYVTKQFQASQQDVAGDIGAFRRMPDISLSDSAVSRLHAMVFHGPNGVGILDLVSKNGTFVNGAEIESKFISSEDVVTIGSSKIRINKRD